MVRRMMPPKNVPVSSLAQETGITEQTLYVWRREAKGKGLAMPGDGKNAEGWSSEDKFAVVLETAPLNAAELAEYRRRKGLYPEQIAAWRASCVAANANAAEQAREQRQQSKEGKQRIKQLEKELHRKEKALAEAAACAPTFSACRHQPLCNGTESTVVLGHYVVAGGDQGQVLLLVHGARRVQPQDRRSRSVGGRIGRICRVAHAAYELGRGLGGTSSGAALGQRQRDEGRDDARHAGKPGRGGFVQPSAREQRQPRTPRRYSVRVSTGPTTRAKRSRAWRRHVRGRSSSCTGTTMSTSTAA